MKSTIILVPCLCVSLTAQVQHSPAQRFPLPPQDQTGKASIEGSVLDAITHEPVKKATVALNGPGGSLLAVTDASGHFAFRQLPAGQYHLFASSEKYPTVQGTIDPDRQLTISVTAEEQKQDVNFALIPGGSVRGRIVDEDGNPMRCNAFALQFHDTGMGRTRRQSGSSQSDDKGEYRISNIPRGKYYVEARCGQTVPLPHAFVRRTSLADVPTLTYPSLFYPGAADVIGAAKVEVSPGTDVAGIDFRMAPARGITVRGHLGPTGDRNIQVTLTREDSGGLDWQRRGAPVNPSTGEFQIRNVLPGSYELFAFSLVEGRSYFAKASVEVGAVPLDPIDLTLAAAPSISGSITIEGDTKMPMNNVHFSMNPLDNQSMMGAGGHQTEVQNDGTFIFNSVMPGRWRINMSVPGGYVKSVKQGDQDVAPWDIEIGSSPVQLKVVVGTKFAQIDAALAAGPAGTEPVSAIIWSANGDPQYQQNMGLNQQGRSRISVPPGKYRACAFALLQTGALMQNRALRKAVESHCETLEASEEGVTQVQLPLIPVADLKQLLEKIEE
jgi:hypothetical protein